MRGVSIQIYNNEFICTTVNITLKCYVFGY